MSYILFGSLLANPSIIFFLTLFPSYKLFDQLKIHDCSPINKFSIIYSRGDHSKFIVKILHLIILVNN
jgi:hypothetical protein